MPVPGIYVMDEESAINAFAFDAISRIDADEVLVGAGTVLSVDQASRAVDAGARVYLPVHSAFETLHVAGATWIESWPFFWRSSKDDARELEVERSPPFECGRTRTNPTQSGSTRQSPCG